MAGGSAWRQPPRAARTVSGVLKRAEDTERVTVQSEPPSGFQSSEFALLLVRLREQPQMRSNLDVGDPSFEPTAQGTFSNVPSALFR
jgi:hypothetical protein